MLILNSPNIVLDLYLDHILSDNSDFHCSAQHYPTTIRVGQQVVLKNLFIMASRAFQKIFTRQRRALGIKHHRIFWKSNSQQNGEVNEGKAAKTKRKDQRGVSQDGWSLSEDYTQSQGVVNGAELNEKVECRNEKFD